MHMMKKVIKLGVVIVLVLFIASATSKFEIQALPSLADHIHLTHSKDPIDGGWLPDLNGLPHQTHIALLTKRVKEIMLKDKDKACNAIDLQLRMMVFQHFVIYQQIANAQHIYFDEKIAKQWAHVLAMILKESSGDSTNITDMKGHSLTTYMANTDLEHWKKILHLTTSAFIQFNAQTNFGLTQTSSDRLFVAFTLAKSQRYNTAFLEGREGAATPRKIGLNTAIAIRRLIWFYQDFAQGRIHQSETRIPEKDIHQPQYTARYRLGLKMALLYCGTPFMFREGSQEMSKLEDAMASIAYCKFGNAQTGYGMNEFDEKCFAEWVTLCPALNVDIATLTPLSYFATRDVKPVCEDTFKALIVKDPNRK